MRAARVWHGVTFVVVVAALVLQTVLVLTGAGVLADTDPPPLGESLLRLVSYFTIQSNVLVAIATGLLLRDPARDGRAFRSLRLTGIVAITVTGLVHYVLLRPLQDLEGASAVTDLLLHVVVPLLAVLGFLVFGPRPRSDRRASLWAVLFPVLWLAYTLVMGQIHGWYPYPFLDVAELGWGRTLLNCGGVTLLFLALLGVVVLADRRLPAVPRTQPAHLPTHPDAPGG